MSSRTFSFLAMTGLLLAGLGTPTTIAANAASSASVLPSKSSVKQAMNGTGAWDRGASSIKVLGSDPRGCRSDRQLLNPSSVRARWYWGQEQGMPRTTESRVQVAVLTYPSATAARAAVKRNRTYPARCPKSTEWVCNECDGVWTTWRGTIAAPRVGKQSTTLRFREVGNFRAKGYVVVARQGKTVVRTMVARTAMDVGDPYPPLGGKGRALRIARLALASAT